MIELMEGLPGGVVGIEAVGKVTSGDYDVVLPGDRKCARSETGGSG